MKGRIYNEIWRENKFFLLRKDCGGNWESLWIVKRKKKKKESTKTSHRADSSMLRKGE